MITRPILEAQKELYEKGRAEALANFNAFNGAIEAIDNLLDILTQKEEAQAKEAETSGEGGESTLEGIEEEE